MTRLLPDRSTWFGFVARSLALVLVVVLSAPIGFALAAEVVLSVDRKVDSNVSGPSIVAAGDLDGDGILDLVAAGLVEPPETGADRLRLYRGNGAAPFAFGAPLNLIKATNQNASLIRDLELADLDRDGLLDYILAGDLQFTGGIPAIGYYRNEGVPPSSNLKIPDFDLPFRHLFGFTLYQGITVADLDGDTFGDVVAVGDGTPSMAWFKSTVDNGVSFAEQSIDSTGRGGPRDPADPEEGEAEVVTGDVDGDGDLDLVAVFWGNDTVAWYESDGQAVPGFTERVLDQDPDYGDGEEDGPLQGFADGPVDVAVADVDDDADLDLIVLSREDDRLTLYLNDGLSPPSFQRQTVTSDPDGAGEPLQGFLDRPTTVVAGDLDGDGDVDVVAGGEALDQMVFFDSDGANPPSFTFRTLSQDPDGLLQVDTTEFNAVPETLEGIPQRTETVDAIVAGEREGLVDGIADLVLEDLDADGDFDLASAAKLGRKVAWHENLACGTGFPVQQIAEFDPDGLTGPEGATAVFPADLDGDGDVDVVTASADDDSIRWFENDGELVPTFTETIVSSTVDGANDAVVADLDGDGNLDIVTASPFDQRVRWFRNDGNSDPEFTENLVGEPAPGVRGVAVGDIDGDGDLDVISAHTAENVVAWWENAGGSPLMFTQHVITRNARGVWTVKALDVDGDGLTDITSTSFANGQVLFFLNIGGTPPEFVELEVTNINPGGGGTGTDRAESPGQDLTGASAAGGFGDVFGTLPGDLEGESSVEPLAAGVSQGAIDVELADMNGDTFVDLVIVSAHDDKIAWYRNTGTVQQRPLEQVITEDPDGTTVREYADTGEVVGPEGACGQREIWRCETDPQPSSPPLECSGACVLPAVGTCEFAPLKSCAFEACVGGLCATSGAECASAADCANAQCGEDVGPCRFSGTCDIPRPLLDPGPSDPVPPEPEPDLPPDLCSTELCIDSQCEFSGAPCSTNVDCEAEQCNFGPCEPFTRYTESIENVQEGVDHGPSAVVIADLDQDGDPDFVVSSVLGNTISWWENNGLPDAVFSRRPVNGALDGPRAVAVADINGDGAPDIVSGSYRDGDISWYLNATGDSCVLFDVNGDGLIDATELSWMGRAFGASGTSSGNEAWWDGIDLSDDGRVDGLDLSILGSSGVWGETVFTCSHTCTQE